MIEAVIPAEHQECLKVAAVVGGMSIQKQQRLLSYKPAIIVATPGRLWELMNEYNVPYLQQTLPMLDVLVLDEADRMIADGHFREMRDILAHIYTQRLQMKTSKKGKPQVMLPKGIRPTAEVMDFSDFKDTLNDQSNFIMGKNLEGNNAQIDLSQIKDLNNEDELFEQMNAEGNIIMDQAKPEEEEESKKKKQKTKSQKELDRI